jgi:uncharacterized protein (DUF1501 family)
MGFPGQSRSHFAASDVWWAGIIGRNTTTGWLGRWLDAGGDVTNPLRAVALGGGASALAAEKSVSTLVLNPKLFTLRTAGTTDPEQVRKAFLATSAPLSNDPTAAAAQHAVADAMQSVDLFAKASQMAADDPSSDPANGQISGQGTKGSSGASTGETQFSDLLTTAAGLIDLQLGTRIIVVSGTGFDTHANQADHHADLLTDLGKAITSFLDHLDKKGRAEEVLVVTTSEFGRRVEENGSGTDHGNGNVHLLAGSMVRGAQVVGQADLAALDHGDVASTIDSRSLYANALDWLSGPNGPTDDILGGHFDRYGLVAT